MCAEMLGFLVHHTAHVPPPLLDQFRREIPDAYRSHFEDGVSATVESWRAGCGAVDPWKARLPAPAVQPPDSVTRLQSPQTATDTSPSDGSRSR
jgi:hypothetical protein